MTDALSERRQLDALIANALEAFMGFVSESGWRGRENEAVNVFAHSFLLPLKASGTLFHHAGQLAIECAVHQSDTTSPRKSGRGKADVRKDLLIWRQPNATHWFPLENRLPPLAVMEWKVGRFYGSSAPEPKVNVKDLAWLSSYTLHALQTTGYAVTTNLGCTPRLVCCRVTEGESEMLLTL